MAKGMGDMMKQVAKMQRKMEEIQKELAETKVEGSAGGGMVKVTANGNQDIISIKIEQEVVNPDDVEMLENMEQLRIEFAERELARSQRIADEKKQQYEDTKQAFISTVNDMFKIINMFYDNQIKKINNVRKKDIARIKASQMSEKQKTLAIQKINEEADAKERELKRKQANMDKAGAIFNIGLSTAQGIMNAWAKLAPPAAAVMTVLIAALGIAQTALVASKPVPFAEGGLVKASPGKGVLSVIGEGRENELVMPLQTGVEMFFDKFMSKMQPPDAPEVTAPIIPEASPVPSTIVHLNVGTLVADDSGLNELDRRLQTFRIRDNQRKGLPSV